MLRNGLQLLRMLLWLRTMRHSRARTETFQLEVGEPEFSEADFDTGEDAAMLGLASTTTLGPMASKSNNGTHRYTRTIALSLVSLCLCLSVLCVSHRWYLLLVNSCVLLRVMIPQ